MGQVLSYIWRCMRPNIEGDSITTIPQNDQFASVEEQSYYYITIPDEDIYMAQPDVITEVVPFIGRVEQQEEEEEEEVVKKVIQLLVTENGDFSFSTSLEEQSHYITIPDVDASAQSDVIPEAPLFSVDLKSNRVVDDDEDDDDDNNVVEQEEIEVVVEKVILEVVKKEVTTQVLAKPNREHDVSEETVRRIGPYNSMQRILLVGEGDFSFSTSLALAFGSDASNMIATSLNSQGFLKKNYSKFLTNKKELEIRGCKVIHGVDATNMIQRSVPGKLKFDRIIYNFPHTGCFGGSYTDLVKNRKLVRGFIRNAKKMMNKDGEIHITHKSTLFFSLWDIPKIGRDQGLHLIQEIKFDRSMFPEYNPKYGFGGDGNFNCDPSKTYKFGLHPK